MPGKSDIRVTISGPNRALRRVSGEPNLRRRTDLDYVLAGVKFIQKCVVVSDDLLELERLRIRRHVPIGNENDVVAEADSAAHGCVHAVLRHASADDEPTNSCNLKLGSEVGLKERIAGSFMDDQITGVLIFNG